MDSIVSWVATAATIVAACMTASNLGARITGYGFAVFTVGSIAWFTLGLLTDQPALVWTNVAMTGLNLFGVWRWLGRQAKVEEGGHAAAKASEATPGETLFPASLLTNAKVRCGDSDVGTSVDGMVGSRSGRLAYVVVSEGGLAGLGERLRRLDWEHARVEGNTIVGRLEAEAFSALDELPKDQWPGR